MSKESPRGVIEGTDTEITGTETGTGEGAGPGPYRPDPMGSCPHAHNARLLAEASVAEIVLPGETPGALVLGHEALKDFLSRPDVGKDPVHFASLQEGRIPDGWPLLTFATLPGMLTSDGDDHRRLRALVGGAFTTRRVEALRPGVETLVAQLLDSLAAAASSGDGVADLRAHLALPLPMGVICTLLGVDDEHRDRLHKLSDVVISTTATPEEAIAANQEMAATLALVAAARAEKPGDDVTSALIAAREADGDRLSRQELIGTLMTLVIAGHETTLNLILNAVRALCSHPEQLAAVRSGRATWSDVVEETLRWDCPVSYFPFRYPVEDITVDGNLIPRGTPVLAGYSAAGRDPSSHGPDAERFDVTRSGGPRHLSLGHGAHYCLGASLARMETAIALESLFTRFPDLEIALPEAELPRHPGFVGNGVQGLPVRVG